MRILYGVTGEGLGHTMRARVLLRHLVAAGHTVKVAASGRAVRVLRDHGFDVLAIDGLCLVQTDGALQRLHTVGRNLRRAPAALGRNLVAATEAIAFAPGVVISDFDSFSYAVGRLLRRPVISIDHQHVLSRCRHDARVLRDVSYDFALIRGVVRRKMPRCDRYLVSSFFFPSLRDECADDTQLIGPIVRPELERLPATENDHVLVYQTGSGDRRLLDMLAAIRHVRFVVYGPRLAQASHLEFRSFSEPGFLADLASARAVIANGGYTTLSEAVSLGKPVLSVPIRHQGEQELNAAYLADEGLGIGMRRPTVGTIRDGLDQILSWPRRPRRFARDATISVDRALAEVA